MFKKNEVRASQPVDMWVLVIGLSFDDCVQSEVVRILRVELQLKTYEELIKLAFKAVDDW